jgi:hypothetical protein
MKILLFSLIVCIGSESCAGSGIATLPPAPEALTASNPTSEDPMKTCWESAKSTSASTAKLEIGDGPLEWPAEQERLRIPLQVVNKSDSPLWFNKRGAYNGTSRNDHEWTINVAATGVGRIVKDEGSGDWTIAKRSDYVVIEPKGKLLINLTISTSDYRLNAGRYELSVCFWDRNSEPPAPPKGAVLMDRAIAAGPVIVVRTGSADR